MSALRAAGLTILQQSDQLMSVDLREHPRNPVPAGYRAETTVDDGVVYVQVFADDASDAARGSAGVVGGYASADKILTWPDHRRRGPGSVVMGILAGAAIELGAETGLLVGGVQGQQPRLIPSDCSDDRSGHLGDVVAIDCDGDVFDASVLQDCVERS